MIGYRKFVIFGISTLVLIAGFISQDTWFKVTVAIVAGNVLEKAPELLKYLLGGKNNNEAGKT